MQNVAIAMKSEKCMPTWVPESAQLYLAHTEAGEPIRALAREIGTHASTVLRRIRSFETRRDDLLVDDALRRLGRHYAPKNRAGSPPKETDMAQPANIQSISPSDSRFEKDSLRILRRLCEAGAVLAVAMDMEKAVVVRDGDSGSSTKTAVVDREIAEAIALKEWIACDAPGRISRYHITRAGRTALNRMVAQMENAASGFAEAQVAFDGAPVFPECEEAMGDSAGKRSRYNMAESPLIALARRRDREGAPFLADELVRAGERLREDFELSLIGSSVTQNWDQFLTGSIDGAARVGGGTPGGSASARQRLDMALRDLGPGLSDIAIKCCCQLEGLERAEKRMGWSARSGKIVLRIALQRLKRHYEMLGDAGGMIG